MSHIRFRQRADAAWKEQTAIKAKLRQREIEAKHACTLRSDSYTTDGKNTKPTWNSSREVAQQQLFGHTILKRNSSPVFRPSRRYNPKRYDAYYLQPFSHTERSRMRDHDRVIHDRISTANLANRIKKFAEQTTPTKDNRRTDCIASASKFRLVREHTVHHGAVHDIFDGEFIGLHSSSKNQLHGTISSSTKSNSKNHDAVTNTSALILGIENNGRNEDMYDQNAQSLKGMELDGDLSRMSKFSLSVDEEDLNEAARSAALAAGWGNFETLDAERKSHGIKQRIEKHESKSRFDHQRHSSASRKHKNFREQSPEDIADAYYQKLLHECPPENIFKDLINIS